MKQEQELTGKNEAVQGAGSRVLWSTCVLRLHLTEPFCFNVT